MVIGYILSKPSLLRNILLSAFAIAAVMTAIAVSIAHFESGSRREAESEYLKLAAAKTAKSIDADLHSNIVTSQDEFTEEYDAISAILEERLAREPYIRSAYTVRKADGILSYVVDVESDLDRDGRIAGADEKVHRVGEAPIGVPLSAISRALQGTAVAEDDFRSGPTGVWLAACAPLTRYDGSVDGALCVESEESRLRGSILTTHILIALSFTILTLAIILLLAALFVAHERLADAAESERSMDSMVDLFDSAFENSSLVSMQVLDGEGKVSLWNRASEEIFGIPRSEAKGRDISDLIVQAPGGTRYRDSLKRVMETGLPHPPGEWHMQNSKGERLTILLTLVPIRHEGSVVEVLAMGVDVTAERSKLEELERQLKQLKDMQESLIRREGRMIELKVEINSLLEKLGESPKYDT